MTLWRLEVARLVRTHRWMILFGVYLFFGALGPLTARYMREIFEQFGGGMTIEVPDPRPVDGIVQFVSNASQLGLLAVVIVAAAALALDARPEVAAFLRTKVEHAGLLLVPRYVVTVAATVLALVAGTALAWVLTVALIGSLPVGSLLLGTLYGALYLAFAVAVVAAVAGYTGSQVTTVFGGLAVLIMLPLLGLLPALAPWMPSELLGAVSALVEGVPAGEFTRSVAVTLVATAALLAVAIRRFEVREV